MTKKINFINISREIKNLANKEKALILQKFFKTGKGQYGEGDIFLGLTVPQQRIIAKKYIALDFKSLERLLKSKIHEFRLIALLILVQKYQASDDLKEKGKIINFYLKNKAFINNWDLVDLSAPKILGDYLFFQKEGVKVLDKLAVSKNLWDKRIAMVSTYAFIIKGKSKEVLRIAKKLLADKHDLIHKASGWMLREVGKRVNRKILLDFLDENKDRMARTALRYAIEHLSEKERQSYLKR